MASIAGENWLEIGRVSRARGRDGALNVALFGDDPANLVVAERVSLRGAPGEIAFRVLGARVLATPRDGRARVELRLAGLDSRERAEAWGGASLAIPEAGLRELPEGEYYWRQIVGLEVYLPDGRPLGEVAEIWPTAAHDLLVVRGAGEPVLVPAVDEILTRVDLDAGALWIDPPAGLVPGEDG